MLPLWPGIGSSHWGRTLDTTHRTFGLFCQTPKDCVFLVLRCGSALVAARASVSLGLWSPVITMSKALCWPPTGYMAG